MRGVIVACDSNTEPYRNIISVQTIIVLDSANEETYHWTSCMLLYEAEYSKKCGAPVQTYVNAINRAQLKSQNLSDSVTAPHVVYGTDSDVQRIYHQDKNIVLGSGSNGDRNCSSISSSSSSSSCSSSSSSSRSNREENKLNSTYIQKKYLTCSCTEPSVSASLVKQQLGYCSCFATQSANSSLDPLGRFGVILLSFLLRLRSVLPSGVPLLRNIDAMK